MKTKFHKYNENKQTYTYVFDISSKKYNDKLIVIEGGSDRDVAVQKIIK